MRTEKLELIFSNEQGKKMTLGVEEPRDDLEKEEVREKMEDIIRENIFFHNGLDLVGIEGARVVTREVEEIF